MGNQRFSITPAAAATDKDLPDSIFRTLAVIGTYGDRNGWCWPSQKTLADIRGVSRQTINSHIKVLIDMQYLNIQPRYDVETGAQQSNMMQIKFDRDYEDIPPVSNLDFTGGVKPKTLQGVSSLDFTHNAPYNAPLEEEQIPTELSTYFTSVSGCFPNAGNDDDWNMVLNEWQKKYGDKVRDMIDKGIKFARGDNPQGKRFVVTSPRSIANIIANLPADMSTNGKVMIGSR